MRMLLLGQWNIRFGGLVKSAAALAVAAALRHLGRLADGVMAWLPQPKTNCNNVHDRLRRIPSIQRAANTS
jgi:hypothetical protein